MMGPTKMSSSTRQAKGHSSSPWLAQERPVDLSTHSERANDLCRRYRLALGVADPGSSEGAAIEIAGHSPDCPSCREAEKQTRWIESSLKNVPELTPGFMSGVSLFQGSRLGFPESFDPTGPADLSPCCADFRQSLDDLLLDRLDREYRRELTDHAAYCTECASRWSNAQRIEKGLARLPDVTPSVHLWQRLKVRIEADRPPFWAAWRLDLSPFFRYYFRTVAPVLALGVVLLLLIVGLPRDLTVAEDEPAQSVTLAGGGLERVIHARSEAIRWEYVENEFKAYTGRLATRKADGL